MLTIRDLLDSVDGLTVGEIRLSVRRGWIKPSIPPAPPPAGPRRPRLRFLEVDAARLRLIRELREEIGIDDETLPLVLSLLDRIYRLRTDLRELTEAISRQPADVRTRIAETIRELRET